MGNKRSASAKKTAQQMAKRTAPLAPTTAVRTSSRLQVKKTVPPPNRKPEPIADEIAALDNAETTTTTHTDDVEVPLSPEPSDDGTNSDVVFEPHLNPSWMSEDFDDTPPTKNATTTSGMVREGTSIEKRARGRGNKPAKSKEPETHATPLSQYRSKFIMLT
jgi:hypothetical protein